MSVNDTQLAGNKAVDVYPGVANPTPSSNIDPMHTNFVTDPTTETRGAGAGANFTGDKDAARNFKQTAGVVEGRPGIIESAHIAPLNEQSPKAERSASLGLTGAGSNGTTGNTTVFGGAETTCPSTESLSGISQSTYDTVSSAATGAASMASNVANAAYKYFSGEDQSRK